MEYGITIPNFDVNDASVTVSIWHKSLGDKVTRGEVLVEVDSCTATCEILAPASGVLETIFIPSGGESKVGEQIGVINSTEEAEYVTYPVNSKNDAVEAFSNEEFNAQEQAQKQEEIEQAEQNIINAEAEINAEIAFGGETSDKEIDAVEAFSNEEFNAQEQAQKQEEIEQAEQNIINAEAEIDAEIAFGGEIIGKEPEKEIYENVQTIKKNTGESVKQILDTVDEIREANELSKHEVEERPETDPNTWNKVTKIPTPDDEIKELSTAEYNIVQRRALAVNTAVISTVINEIDMTNVISASNLFGEEFYKKHHVHLGYTAFILKAVVKALREFPMLNAYMLDDKEITYRNNYDISIIMHDVDSLASPVIRNVDNLTIHELQSHIIKLSERAKNNELTLEETTGATFTVINAGSFGSLLGSDLVTHPQIAALTMHKVTNRPIVDNSGRIIARPMMYMSLSFDHRISNSKSASLFLEKVKILSENLSWMALEI